MNGYFNGTVFRKWGEKKRLNILAGLCILCFAIACITGFYLVVAYWDGEKLFISITLASLVAGWVLKKIVNSQERSYKEEEKEIWEDYWSQLKSADSKRREELYQRMLRCQEFISNGVNPREAYRKAKGLEAKQEGRRRLK